MKDLKKIILAQDLEYKELEDGTLMIQKKERAPFKLEVGKDYISEDGKTIVIDREGDRWNNGFHTKRSIESRRCFSTSIICSKPSYWKEATEEQVREAFEKELLARCGEDWENIQLKNNIDPNTVKGFNSKTYTPKIIKNYRRGWDVWNKNGLLYYDGKWAEVLEEKKTATDLSDIVRPYYIDLLGKITRSNPFSRQTKNQMTSKELCEGILALQQLISFRDDFHKVYGKPEGENMFAFNTKEQKDIFEEAHKELFEELKKLY